MRPMLLTPLSPEHAVPVSPPERGTPGAGDASLSCIAEGTIICALDGLS